MFSFHPSLGKITILINIFHMGLKLETTSQYKKKHKNQQNGSLGGDFVDKYIKYLENHPI